MPAVRIVPCLDVANGRVVKGVQFRDHRDIGDIVEHALRYAEQGADELVFYEIKASAENRSLDLGWVRDIADVIDIPFCVAGGIRDRATAAAVLEAGADKISINSPALERPELIEELARDFGSQCVVIGIDSSRGDDGRYRVKQYTGSVEATRDAGRETTEWASEAAARGAGEIVLNAMARDGVRQGYDLAHARDVMAAVDVPLIVSGGAGAPEHFRDAFRAGASAALAATLDSGLVTFFSRSKARLWRKGETSGNVLRLVSIATDCDGDALLVRAEPAGPTCHLGTDSCFAVEAQGAGWLSSLERIVTSRAAAPPAESYTARLIAEGTA